MIGECECCSNTAELTLKYGNMLMCNDCIVRDDTLHTEAMLPANVEKRVQEMNAKIVEAKSIDSAITLRSDIFNAKTVAIVELKSIIDADKTIVNKQYELTSQLTDRFLHLKDVVFELTNKLVDAGNEQRAIQTYLNDLSNKLTVEERTKLKLQDINYKPAAPKSINPKKIKTNSVKKLNKEEINKYAIELGISTVGLQMICVSRGITPEQAANELRRSINEAKSESH